tara:strand:+ start:10552 stop:11589 length:1038 start_codon:yes stop_codon:yes gene_type:complete
MINNYTFYESPQNKLHDFVISFFNKIEFETTAFSEDFFIKEFYDNLVSRHTGILRKSLKNIYDIIKDWKQIDKTLFCEAIRKSNDIKGICNGDIIPWKEADIPLEVRELTKTLFIKLYEDVLKGSIFKENYGGRLDHYHAFKKIAHNDYEFCPACGMVEMKTYEDKRTDQYDHYLPKDIYPFSSVNFENLVPICIDCNSLEVKSNKDILSYTGKVFYPFEGNMDQIIIEIQIKTNNTDLSKIVWDIDYSCIIAKDEEIQAWKNVYNIESRHQTHVSGRIGKWYELYNDYMNDKELINDIPEIRIRANSYLRSLRKRKTLEKKSLEVLINTFDLIAREEANKYSRF